MKLSKNSSIFNAGDTSLRVKFIIEEYKEVLHLLHEFRDNIDSWSEQDQIEFEKQLYKLDRFKNREKTESEGQRARTVTSILYKMGFCDSKRNLSSVGHLLLGHDSLDRTEFEELFDISDDSLIFLRQLLKFRVYDSEGQSYFYPFRIFLKLLIDYNNVPKQDLLFIVHGIEPQWDKHRIEDIIECYSSVSTKQIDFKTFYHNKFISSREEDQHTMFDFKNRKSSSKKEKYKEFLLSIERYLECRTEANLKLLLNISNDKAIKKAFGFGTNPFVAVSSKQLNKLTPKEFDAKTKNNMLLYGTLSQQYDIFLASKKFDLTKEYSDITMRLMNSTGIIKNNSNIVNITYKEILESVIANIELCGKGSFEKYDNINSVYYKNHSLDKILNNKKVNVASIISTMGCKTSKELKEVIRNRKSSQFEEFIQEQFPVGTIIDILQKIKNREDATVQKIVTTEASVPAIYEYILGIAWYYISDRKVDLLSGLNLPLDGSFLPINHAPGGVPDLQFSHGDICVNIEATLSENYSQTRMEVIPIITHTTDSIKNTGKKNLTIFVANNLSTQCVTYLYSLFDHVLSGEAVLLPRSTDHMIKLLQRGVMADDIISKAMLFFDDEITFDDKRFEEFIDNM